MLRPPNRCFNACFFAFKICDRCARGCKKQRKQFVLMQMTFVSPVLSVSSLTRGSAFEPMNSVHMIVQTLALFHLLGWKCLGWFRKWMKPNRTQAKRKKGRPCVLKGGHAMPSFFSPPCGRCLGAGKVFLDCGCNLSWHSPGPTNSRTAIVLEDLKSIQNHLWVKRVCYCNRVAWCCVFPTGLFEGNLHLWDIPEAGSGSLGKISSRWIVIEFWIRECSFTCSFWNSSQRHWKVDCRHLVRPISCFHSLTKMPLQSSLKDSALLSCCPHDLQNIVFLCVNSNWNQKPWWEWLESILCQDSQGQVGSSAL